MRKKRALKVGSGNPAAAPAAIFGERAPLLAAMLEDWDSTQPFRFDVLREAFTRWPDITFQEIARALELADQANRFDRLEEETMH